MTTGIICLVIGLTVLLIAYYNPYSEIDNWVSDVSTAFVMGIFSIVFFLLNAMIVYYIKHRLIPQKLDDIATYFLSEMDYPDYAIRSYTLEEKIELIVCRCKVSNEDDSYEAPEGLYDVSDQYEKEMKSRWGYLGTRLHWLSYGIIETSNEEETIDWLEHLEDEGYDRVADRADTLSYNASCLGLSPLAMMINYYAIRERYVESTLEC